MYNQSNDLMDNKIVGLIQNNIIKLLQQKNPENSINSLINSYKDFLSNRQKELLLKDLTESNNKILNNFKKTMFGYDSKFWTEVKNNLKEQKNLLVADSASNAVIVLALDTIRNSCNGSKLLAKRVLFFIKNSLDENQKKHLIDILEKNPDFSFLKPATKTEAGVCDELRLKDHNKIKNVVSLDNLIKALIKNSQLMLKSIVSIDLDSQKINDNTFLLNELRKLILDWFIDEKMQEIFKKKFKAVELMYELHDYVSNESHKVDNFAIIKLIKSSDLKETTADQFSCLSYFLKEIGHIKLIESDDYLSLVLTMLENGAKLGFFEKDFYKGLNLEDRSTYCPNRENFSNQIMTLQDCFDFKDNLFNSRSILNVLFECCVWTNSSELAKRCIDLMLQSQTVYSFVQNSQLILWCSEKNFEPNKIDAVESTILQFICLKFTKLHYKLGSEIFENILRFLIRIDAISQRPSLSLCKIDPSLFLDKDLSLRDKILIDWISEDTKNLWINTVSGSNVLHCLCEYPKNLELITYLLEKFYKAEDRKKLQKEAKYARNLLHIFCEKFLNDEQPNPAMIKVIKFFLQEKLSPAIIDRDLKLNCLHIICRKNNDHHLELIQLFLDKGVNINSVNGYGETVLHYLIEHQNPNNNLINFLLQKGADPFMSAKNNNCFDLLNKEDKESNKLQLTGIKKFYAQGYMEHIIPAVAKKLFNIISDSLNNSKLALFEEYSDYFEIMKICTSIVNRQLEEQYITSSEVSVVQDLKYGDNIVERNFNNPNNFFIENNNNNNNQYVIKIEESKTNDERLSDIEDWVDIELKKSMNDKDLLALSQECKVLRTHYSCGICFEIFEEPVTVISQKTFEKKHIETWLETKNTCPLTKIDISVNKRNLIINTDIKQIISETLSNLEQRKLNLMMKDFNNCSIF